MKRFILPLFAALLFVSCQQRIKKEFSFSVYSRTTDRELPYVKCVRAVLLEKDEFLYTYAIVVEFSEPVSIPEEGGIFVSGITGDISNGLNSSSPNPNEIFDVNSIQDKTILLFKTRLKENEQYYVKIVTSVTDLSGNKLDGEKYAVDGCSETINNITQEPDGINTVDITRLDDDYMNIPVDYTSLTITTGTPDTVYKVLGNFYHPSITEIFVNKKPVDPIFLEDGENISNFSLYGIGARVNENPVFTISLTVPSSSKIKNISAKLFDEDGREIPVEIYNPDKKKWDSSSISDWVSSLTIPLRPMESLENAKIYKLIINPDNNLIDEGGIKFVDRKYDGMDNSYEIIFTVQSLTIPGIKTLIIDPETLKFDSKTLSFGFLTPDASTDRPFGEEDLISSDCWMVKGAVENPDCSKRIILKRTNDGSISPQTIFNFTYPEGTSNITSQVNLPPEIIDTKGNFLDTNADGTIKNESPLNLGILYSLLEKREYRKKILNDLEREPNDTPQEAFPFLNTSAGVEIMKTTNGDVDFINFEEPKGILIGEVLFMDNLLATFENGSSAPLYMTFTLYDQFMNEIITGGGTGNISPFSLSISLPSQFKGFLSLICSGDFCTENKYSLRLFNLSSFKNEPEDNNITSAHYVKYYDFSKAVNSTNFPLPDPDYYMYASTITGNGDVDWLYTYPLEGTYCVYLLNTGDQWDTSYPSISIYSESESIKTALPCSTLNEDNFFLSCDSFEAEPEEEKIYIKIEYSYIITEPTPYSIMVIYTGDKTCP